MKQSSKLRGVGTAALATWMLLTLTPGTAAADRWFGPEVRQLSMQSLDVVKMHLYVLRAQLALDETPFFFELAMRSTPGEFALNDGTVEEGGLTRLGLSFGGGFGKPTTGWALFAGVQVDQIAITEFPAFITKHGVLANATQIQGIIYAGAAAHGFQLSWGGVFDAPFGGLDANGRFAAPGAMGDAAAVGDSADQSVRQIFTFTHAEGIRAGGAIAEVGGEKILTTLRTELSPEHLWERLGLREYGLTMIGVNRYAAQVDYYLDKLETLQNVTAAPSAALDDELNATYEVPLRQEDILGTGAHAQLVTQVRPDVLFRSLEVGWQTRVEIVDAAARAMLFRRGDGHELAVEAFVSFRPEWFKYFSFYGVPKITLSYSYNTPESTTFLPIPGAHVVGAQWIYGPSEMGRPLVPLIPKVEKERAEAQ